MMSAKFAIISMLSLLSSVAFAHSSALQDGVYLISNDLEIQGDERSSDSGIGREVELELDKGAPPVSAVYVGEAVLTKLPMVSESNGLATGSEDEPIGVSKDGATVLGIELLPEFDPIVMGIFVPPTSASSRHHHHGDPCT